MPKNEGLAKVVAENMFDFLKDKDVMLFGEDKQSSSGLILGLGDTHVDEQSKFRMIRRRIMGYGYDFKGEVDHEPAKDMFERAVKNTKEYSGNPHFEKFLASGIAEDRYGWYITEI